MDLSHIPILNYHKIDPSGDIGITSRHPDTFLQDLKTLHTDGFHTITFKDLSAKKPLPPKPLILTFDDGYASVFKYALPLMKQFDFRAVVFMPAAFIGRNNDWDVQFLKKKYKHLTPDELKILSKEGFEIAAHGMSHRALTAKQVDVDEEVSATKQYLEALLQDEIITFCYPFGRFNSKTIEKVRRAGYDFGVASLHYRKLPQEMKKFALRRFNIYAMDSQKMLLRKSKLNFNSLTAYRDYLFQLGGRATVLYQNAGFMKSGK